MALTPQLTEAVLQELGFDALPPLDRGGLDEVYAAWCRRVPFDNVVKRIHLTSGSGDRIGNGPLVAFFESWLRHGTGGTCWPSAGGLHALLVSVGFDARRGSAAMFDDLSGPIHTHGTTLVRLDGKEIGCLLLDADVTAEHYLVRYEASRDMSPFNTMLYATRNTDGARVTLALDTRFERRAGGITSAPLGADRARVMVEEFGYSEEIVDRLPPDET